MITIRKDSTTVAARYHNHPRDPEGALGSSLGTSNNAHQLRRRRDYWKPLFIACLVLAAATCGLSVWTGSCVLPVTHAAHNLDHSEQHPYFAAPANTNLRERQRKQNLERGHNNASSKAGSTTNREENKNNIEMKQQQKYHMVFSTSCSAFQNWQALAFFYFARKVRQPGTVTRLVSGCTDLQAHALKAIHQERVVPLAIEGLQAFEMHVTPDFDESNGGDQKYFNKPNGLLHWMEHVLGFGNNNSETSAEDDAIIIVVDPDMMLLRPIKKDFSSRNYRDGWVETLPSDDHHEEEEDVVTHGRPHAQRYDYGSDWLLALGENAGDVVGEDSPALTVSEQAAADYYPAGPPYVATARDMHKIAVRWVEFLPRYHQHFPDMMCEMHSYSLAVAHLGLPHKLATGFMVSDYGSSENFGFIDDKMEVGDVCMEAPKLEPTSNSGANLSLDPSEGSAATDPAYERLGIEIRDLPFVLHYCQRYALGRYFFSKYKLPEESFDDCEAPLLLEPPRNVAGIYDWNIFPNGVEHWNFAPHPWDDPEAILEKARLHKRNGWFLCAIIAGINEAITAYKTASCGTDARYFQKKYHFHEPEAFRKALEDPSNPFPKIKRAGRNTENTENMETATATSPPEEDVDVAHDSMEEQQPHEEPKLPRRRLSDSDSAE